MKTLNQIYKYTSDCRFPDDDWKLVLSYCRERFKGGKIHKSIRPISNSTFDQFLNWIDNGIGAGDYVAYGKTMGIVKNSTPEGVTLAAYCDYDGNLIINDMPVLNPERLTLLDDDRIDTFKRLMYDAGKEFYIRSGIVGQLYTPKKYFYVTFEDGKCNESCVGMFLKSEDCKYYFVALLRDKKLELNTCIESHYTPLKQANETDIKRLHQAAEKAGLSYNERTHQFVKTPKRVVNNVYHYLNERFEIVSDRDNGSAKHTQRYEAGNYIVDYTEALLFQKDVLRLRGKI